MPELIADVLAIADRLDAEILHLVGHDWGGVVAWRVAGQQPHGSHADGRVHPAPARVCQGDGFGAEWVDTYTRALAEPGALSAALAWYRAATTTGRRVSGPYRFEVLAGAGHWLPEQHAEEEEEEVGCLLLEHLWRWDTRPADPRGRAG